MYDFTNVLFEGEKILYQGEAKPGKGGKGLLGIFCMIGFFLGIIILITYSTIVNHGYIDINLGSIFIYLIFFAFLGFSIYLLFDNLIFKKRRIAGNCYCLTDMRVIKYNFKKNKLYFGYLAYYDSIYSLNIKDNCGDVYFSIVANDKSGDSLKDLVDLKNLILNPNEENMPSISFESVDNPDVVVALAMDARNNIIKNNM